MKSISHIIWFARWIQRLVSSFLRKRKIIDLIPSFIAPTRRIIFDRRFNELHFFSLRKQLSDYWSYDHCLSKTSFDIDMFYQSKFVKKRYQEILNSGDVPVIIDCGANIGLSSYWFAQEFPEAKIFAVEPDSENVRFAKINTKKCSNVKIIEAAISSEDCSISITNINKGADAYQTIVDNTGSIQGFSIVNLLSKNNVNLSNLLLVKVDIEGFENELFSKNYEWVEEASLIIIEPHDWMLPGKAISNNFLKVISSKSRDFLIHGEHVLSFKLQN